MSQEPENWSDAPASVEPHEDEAHVWCASLEPPAARLATCLSLLAPDERERAARFHFEKDHRHFTVARAVLRDVLARYLKRDPAALGFTYNEYGKPELERADERPVLHFNMSHAHGVALCALTYGREVGVDVEFLREEFASLDVARSFFSRAEVEMLEALPVEQRTRGFFNCWTRKEAYIKALGEGLSHPLDRFAVTLAPRERARFLSIDDDPQEVARWSMFALPAPEENYAAALVIEGTVRSLKLWRYAWS